MSDLTRRDPLMGLKPDDTLQLGPDDFGSLTLHEKVGGTYDDTPIAVWCCAGDADRSVDLGSVNHDYSKWTEYLYVASGKLDTLASSGDGLEMRFWRQSDLEASGGVDVRDMMADSTTDIYSGDQNPSWSSSGTPPSDTLGTSAHRVLVDLNTAGTEIDTITWYHTTNDRVYKSGLPTSAESYTRGAGASGTWYSAGGAFSTVSRSSIES